MNLRGFSSDLAIGGSNGIVFSGGTVQDRSYCRQFQQPTQSVPTEADFAIVRLTTLTVRGYEKVTARQLDTFNWSLSGGNSTPLRQLVTSDP